MATIKVKFNVTSSFGQWNDSNWHKTSCMDGDKAVELD